MILAILQARVSSSRLPAKVLRPLLGEPMILRQIERIRAAQRIDHLVLATSIESSDDELEILCQNIGVDCFRGDLLDVLDRFYRIGTKYCPDHIVRLTGDCPLIDYNIIDNVIRKHIEGDFDYTSNTNPPTFPDGLDVEVFRFSCLKEAWRDSKLLLHREHVTPFMWQQPERFNLGLLRNNMDLSDLRWTVDEPEDFIFVAKVYKALYPGKPLFTMSDVLDLLKREPWLTELNCRHKRNEAMLKNTDGD